MSAHYMSNGRNIYARATLEPDGPYEINVADVGAENWAACSRRIAASASRACTSISIARRCASTESEPTLEKLADLLKARIAPGGRDPGARGQHRPGRCGGAANAVGRPREDRRRVADRARRPREQGHVERYGKTRPSLKTTAIWAAR